MLSFFKDSALTLPVTGVTPKWVSLPLKGGVKTTSLYLGDAYTTLVAQHVAISDSTIFLTQTDELPATGTVKIDTDTITYTGVTSSTITGCAGVGNAHTVGTKVYPQITYTAAGNISVLVGGMPNGPILLSLAPPAGLFGPPGVPALYSSSTIGAGVSGALQVRLQFTAGAGVQADYVNLSLSETPVARPEPWRAGSSTITIQVQGPISIQQRDQGLQSRLRLLPANRQVDLNLPGFKWGEYRWRDNTTENAVAIVPTKWDIDTSLITQDFIGGVGSIGETQDLEPIDLEEQNSSIFMRVNRGQYFTGVKRYYFPSDNWNLEFLACYPGQPFTYPLLKSPREQTPVFVGTWHEDGQGFYEFALNARYTFDSNFQPNSSSPQFKVDRETKILTVNAAVQQPQQTILIGVLSGDEIEIFDIPTYPIDKIVNLYVSNPVIPITNFTFNRENGTLTFSKIGGTSAQQPLYAKVDAAIAVLYEYDVNDNLEIANTNIPDAMALRKDTRLLTPDLNPAFSGLASGHVYIQHRVIRPVAVVLSADKPQIQIPATMSSIIGLIAYGPIFYNGDYALLAALAVGSLPNEIVPGARLQVIPGGLDPVTGLPLQTWAPFRGLINGLDPNTNTIIITTGGDGIANLVFQPEPDFGYYIPTAAPWVFTTSISNDSLLLPAQIPISQIWDGTNWLTFIYSVLNNEPLFGLIGGVPANGELPFVTNGTVNGDVSIASVTWDGAKATFTLAGPPTNLEAGQNVFIAGCTTGGLNGYQNVFSVGPGNFIVTFNTTAAGGPESESGADVKYSNFRANGVLSIWDEPVGSPPPGTPTLPIKAFDINGNEGAPTPAGGFNGKVAYLQFDAALPTPSHLAAYFFQFLEREIIQVQVVGTNILSNSIMLQMETPQQLLNDPYLVLSIAGVFPSWAPSTTYALNAEVEVTIGSPPVGYIMKVTTTGGVPVSDVTPPSWNTVGTTSETGSSTLVWTSQGVPAPSTVFANANTQSRMNINRLGITPAFAGGDNSTQTPS